MTESAAPRTLVPEHLTAAVFSDHAMLHKVGDHYVLDFLQSLPGAADAGEGEPTAVLVARVAIPPNILRELADKGGQKFEDDALQQALGVRK